MYCCQNIYTNENIVLPHCTEVLSYKGLSCNPRILMVLQSRHKHTTSLWFTLSAMQEFPFCACASLLAAVISWKVSHPAAA